MAEPWLDDFIDSYNELRMENIRLREQIREMEADTRVREPLIHLESPQNINVEPGEELEFDAIVRNIGSHSAHSFLSTATVSAGAPFVVEFLNNSNRSSTINQNSTRRMTMLITVDATASPGDTGTITLTHRYNNANGAPADSTDTITVRVGGTPAGTSNVRLGNFQASQTLIGPDQSFNVTATLENLGAAPAYNVQIDIANLAADAIFLTSDLNQAFFATLAPGESNQISFTFRTARGIASNTYSINFRIGYDGVAAADRRVTPFFVNVMGEYEEYSDESPNLEIRAMSVPTARLNVGQTGRITFELVNTGDAVAHNILVSAVPLGEGHLVPTTVDRQRVPSLAVGGTRNFEFGFMPTVTAGTHSHPIRLRVEYEIRGGTGEPTPFIQYVALDVYNPPEEPDEPEEPADPSRTLIPRIIVSAYTVYPQIPRAGQNFEMEITFMNTSSTRAVHNIRIVLEADMAATTGGQAAAGPGAVFTPVGGSNTLFVPTLAPGEEATRTITMFTVPDAAPRMYTLNVRLDYQDEDYDVHDAAELLSIPVAQFSRLETDPRELTVPSFMDMMGSVDFDFRVLNTGRVDLHNVRVRVDGNFDTSFASMYMGRIRVQQTNHFRGRIMPLEPGFHEGAVVVYGEDDAGEIVELIHPFAIEVGGGWDGGMDDYFDGGMFEGDDGWFEGGGRYPMGDMWGEEGFGEEDEGGGILGFLTRPYVWGPVAGLIAAGIAFAIYKLRRKKSQLDFDDED